MLMLGHLFCLDYLGSLETCWFHHQHLVSSVFFIFIFQVLNITRFGCATWTLIPLDYGRGIVHGVKRMRRSRVTTEIPTYGAHTSFRSQFISSVTCQVTCLVVIISNFWVHGSSNIGCTDLNGKCESGEARDTRADCVQVPDTNCSVLSLGDFQEESSLTPQEIDGLESFSSLPPPSSCRQEIVRNILWF